jgi:hypothetical protein
VRTREEVVAGCLGSAPAKAQTVLERAYAGSASPREGIKAKCLECLNFDRLGIRDCTGYSCPLWAYRPYQVSKHRQKAPVEP